MKKSFLFTVLFFASALFYGHDGVMEGEKNLRITKTEHFDFIFPEKSQKSAEMLFEYGEQIYSELKVRFQLKNDFRLPVVISPSQDEYNAYFSCAPFNHIVMYDTSADETSAFFKDEFTETFRHELTHAVSYNLRNDSLYRFDRIFGDTWNPALLTVTMGIAEGTSVAVESQNGSGRLNSDFQKNLVRQAKMEGKFPKYSEIQGARDIYPSGYLSYYFGGAFMKYLQETYGNEKFAAFWYRLVNFKNLTYYGAFKKVYGIKIKDAWNDFYESIPVPEISSEADTIKAISPLFKNEKNKNRFITAASGPEKLVYYNIYDSKVRLAYGKNLEKTKTLFKNTSINQIEMSNDQRFLAVSETLQNYHPENRIFILDMKKKSRFSIPERNIRDASIFNLNGELYVSCVQTFSSQMKLKIFKLEMKKDSVKNAELFYSLEIPENTKIYSPEAAPDGNIYFIEKNEKGFSIKCLNPATEELFNFSLPEKMEIQGLRLVNEHFPDSKIRLSFSYTLPGTLPRLGILKTDGKTAETDLTQKDFSGGIFFPSYAGNRKFAFTGEFLNGNGIYFIDSSKIKAVSVNSVISKAEYKTEKRENKAVPVLESSKPFHPFAYNFTGPHGTILPFSIAETYEIKSSGTELESRMLPFGLSYITSSPWTMPVYGISGGYSLLTNSGALYAFIQGGSRNTDFYSYFLSGQAEFDSDGFKQTVEKLSVTNYIPLSGIWKFTLSENLSTFYGRMSDLDKDTDDIESIGDIFEYMKPEYCPDYFYERNKTGIGFSSVHRSGKDIFDYSGISFSALYDQNYLKRVSDSGKELFNYNNVGFDFTARTSLLRPLTFEAALYPSNSYIAALLGKMVIFNYEIQKSTSVFPLFYFNRITLSTYYLGKFREENHRRISSWAVKDTGSYAEKLFSGDFDYSDQAALTASLYITPDIGGLARSNFEFSVNGSFLYRFFPESDEKRFAVSLYANLGY